MNEAKTITQEEAVAIVTQFIADASWRMPSAHAAQHACLELQALRASWLKALEAIGMTEEEARKKGAHLCRRAPK
jgi:hypothetical protein